MDLLKFARLAHLDLTPQEQEEFASQIQSVLAHVRSLEAVNTQVASPTTGAGTAILATPLRDDDGGDELRVASRGDLVELSNSNIGHCFVVPQVVG